MVSPSLPRRVPSDEPGVFLAFFRMPQTLLTPGPCSAIIVLTIDSRAIAVALPRESPGIQLRATLGRMPRLQSPGGGCRALGIFYFRAMEGQQWRGRVT
jgi:hypothetical protein